MNSKLLYQLYGFSYFELRNNKVYNLDHPLIQSIYIGDKIDKMEIELRNGVNYEQNSCEIESFVDHVCFNLIRHDGIEVKLPKRKLVAIDGNEKIDINLSLDIVCNLTIVKTGSVDTFYNGIVNSPTSFANNTLIYNRVIETLNNNNKVVQFLSLYDLMLDLASNGKTRKEQKNVSDYIKNNNQYNIEFFPTRRPNSNFEEDNFTYLRNELGHCESNNDVITYRELGNKVDDILIKKVLCVINDMILEANN